MPKKKPPAPTSTEKPAEFLTDSDVSALCRLIDHCKRQEIAYFEGPKGLRFGFSRAGSGPRPDSKVKDPDAHWIP